MRLVGRVPAPPYLDDDDVRRDVVRRYAYNPVRHERRHQVVAVLGSRRAFERELDRTQAELGARHASDVDPREHCSGVVHEPGHRWRAVHRRLVRRAVEHGVRPAGLERLELPGSAAVLSR